MVYILKLLVNFISKKLRIKATLSAYD